MTANVLPGPVLQRWSPTLVAARLAEAADTLRRLPTPRLHNQLTRWPDVIRAAAEAYGYDPARLRLGPASAAAITRMDQTLDWLAGLEREAQRLLWARACGLSWRRIAGVAGCAPNTARARHFAALVDLVASLENAGVTPRAAAGA